MNSPGHPGNVLAAFLAVRFLLSLVGYQLSGFLQNPESPNSTLLQRGHAGRRDFDID
jgi:hypothetical protein